MLKRGVAFVSMAALAVGTVGAQTAEKPAYKVGDKWVFQQTEADGKTTTWSREIVEVGAGGLKVRMGSGAMGDYDDAMNFGDSGGQNVRVLARYPMKVGDSWSFSRRVGASGQSEERGEAKVTAQESITVRAGQYDCFKVEARSTTATRGVNDQREWVRWYCPAVKWIAREETKTLASRYGQGTSHSETKSELVSFTPGP
jgi:maltoporin